MCAGPDLRISSHPLPLTTEESLQLDTVLSVLAAIFVLIPFCYLSGELVVGPAFCFHTCKLSRSSSVRTSP